MENINKRIAQLRKTHGLSMAKLASIIDVSPGNISDWESEKKKSTPTAKALIALSHYFQVSLDWLMTGSEPIYEQAYQHDSSIKGLLLDLNRQLAQFTPEDLELIQHIVIKFAKAQQTYKSYEEQQSNTSSYTVRENKIESHYYVKLPLVGRVTAGMPLPAFENIEEYLPVPKSLVNSSDKHFLLRIQGDSMINADIHNNDLIIVRQQSTADNGDVVVALVDDEEATVKTFYKESDWIRLQPENSTMKPILGTNIKVIGKVTGVLRNQ